MRDEIIQKLLEGIRRYGLENVSTLSKWIDIPVETARYMIWEELPKHGIDIGVSIDLRRIGLSRWILTFKPNKKTYTDRIEKALKKGAGLMYMAKQVPYRSSFAILAIPFGEDIKLREQFEELKNKGVIEEYSFEEIEWMRYLSFDPSYYDFKQRKWNFNWAKLENKEPLLTPYSKSEEPLPQIDYKDILILKELREKVPRTLSKLSGTIGLDQHNLRYHYKNHARLVIEGYYLKLFSTENQDNNVSLKFVYTIENERSLIETRSIAVSLPFTTHVWKTEKTYGWSVRCPGDYVRDLLTYVNERFTNIQGKLELLVIDAKSEFEASLPHDLFDESSGTWHYEPVIAFEQKEIERVAMDVKKLAYS